MQITLAEHIRSLRKERGLTQEQLAEALGVTAGAVYKWEAKLSTPELSLLLELADFFDTSVDVLLGYELRNNGRKDAVQRLKNCLHTKDPNGPTEAEKALKKYPNCFEVVYECAHVCQVTGMERRDPAALERSIQLYRHACRLLDQNTDPQLSRASIQGQIAQAHISLGRDDEAVALLQQENPCRVNESLIGLTLASGCNRPEEALPHLSLALLDCVTNLIQIAFGYANAYDRLRKYDSAADILQWVLSVLPGLSQPGESSFLDKTASIVWTFLAMIEQRRSRSEAAKDALRQAVTLASAFDQSPCYDAGRLRFMVLAQQGTAHDDIGRTALDGIRQTLREMNDPALTAIWEEISHESL